MMVSTGILKRSFIIGFEIIKYFFIYDFSW